MRTPLACAAIIGLTSYLALTSALARVPADPAIDMVHTPSEEPFASTSISTPKGPLTERWQSAQAAIQSELATMSDCRMPSEPCPSPAARGLLTIVQRARPYDGFAKLAIVNGGVNAAIQYAAHQRDEPWPTALATFDSRRGNCMDFAIAKYTALLQSGWPSTDMRLVLVWPNGASQPHMVLAARYHSRWFVLDNARSAVLLDAKFKNYVPLFVLDHLGVRELVPDIRPQSIVLAARPQPRSADGTHQH